VLIEYENLDAGRFQQVGLSMQVCLGYFVKVILRVGDEVLDLIGGCRQVFLRSFGDSHYEQYPQQHWEEISPIFIQKCQQAWVGLEEFRKDIDTKIIPNSEKGAIRTLPCLTLVLIRSHIEMAKLLVR